MIQHLMFQPTLNGRYDASEGSLDSGTPCGLFWGVNGKYLVCDDPYHRFAVALEHTEIEPFTMFRLGDIPADMGECYGVGPVHLGKSQEWDRVNCVLGWLDVDVEHLKLLVRDLSGNPCWVTIAHGTGGALRRMYHDWSMMVDQDEPFFGTSGWQ